MKDGAVQCPSCENNVSPRLWHNHLHSWVMNSNTSHICPICGVTMYVTGKRGVTTVVKVIGVFLAIQFVSVLLSALPHTLGMPLGITANIIFLYILFRVLLKIFPAFDKKWEGIKNKLFTNKLN